MGEEKTALSVRHQIDLIRMLTRYLASTRYYWLKDAKRKIEELDLSEKEKRNTYKAFVRDYNSYRQTWKEYNYEYRFPELTKKQKKEILTMRDLLCIIRKYHLLYPKQWETTGNKQKFLVKYAPFIHRRWMLVGSTTDPKDVQRFIDSFDVIAKPTNAESGKGVYKIRQGERKAEELVKRKRPVLLEECVRNVEELAEFHPSSLNTVRVVTVSNRNEARILGTTLRTGNHNSVFDNADAGGYFAVIDPETGIVVSNGINEMGQEVAAHPTSGKVFKGVRIPKWNEVIDTCKKAALHDINNSIIAWDIAVTPDGIDIIEGNSIPSIELHQAPLHRGIRRELYATLDELHMPYKDVLFWMRLINRLILILEQTVFRIKCPKKCVV